MSSHLDDAVAALEDQLADQPDRGEIRLQLGMALIQRGDYRRAEEEVARAAQDLDPDEAPREHATALNLMGTVCRDTGRFDLAGEFFARAASTYEAADAALEQGAALHNLGLVERDLGDVPSAMETFREARELLDRGRVPRQAATNLRELGSSLLTHGDLDEAISLLEDAADLAGRAGDVIGEGSAANSLGLGRLAAGDVDGAVAAFQRARAAHPRSIRADGYAMATANLALAHERGGNDPRARLSAAQALAVPDAPHPVVAQATAVLERLGSDPDDFHRALDDAAKDDWERLARAEVDRWTLLGDDELTVPVDGWIAGLLARDGGEIERTAVLLGRFLELPPPDMDRLVTVLVERTAPLTDEGHDRVRRAVSRALARFPVPQWMRLRETFRAATGGDEDWG
ncbi:MAG: tetratricopeptide repeat protein [Nitriliruptorales bacterium]|nr:tetratricopeptide repeat protein [Nitriliruptorales bacterium]